MALIAKLKKPTEEKEDESCGSFSFSRIALGCSTCPLYSVHLGGCDQYKVWCYATITDCHGQLEGWRQEGQARGWGRDESVRGMHCSLTSPFKVL